MLHSHAPFVVEVGTAGRRWCGRRNMGYRCSLFSTVQPATYGSVLADIPCFLQTTSSTTCCTRGGGLYGYAASVNESARAVIPYRIDSVLAAAFTWVKCSINTRARHSLMLRWRAKRMTCSEGRAQTEVRTLLHHTTMRHATLDNNDVYSKRWEIYRGSWEGSGRLVCHPGECVSLDHNVPKWTLIMCTERYDFEIFINLSRQWFHALPFSQYWWCERRVQLTSEAHCVCIQRAQP